MLELVDGRNPHILSAVHLTTCIYSSKWRSLSALFGEVTVVILPPCLWYRLIRCITDTNVAM